MTETVGTLDSRRAIRGNLSLMMKIKNDLPKIFLNNILLVSSHHFDSLLLFFYSIQKFITKFGSPGWWIPHYTSLRSSIPQS